ncbi:unnamed protein product, partial [marine sediment metagenome]
DKNIIHRDLLATKALVYNPCEFKCSPPIAETESTEYGAYAFNLNGFSTRFRVAKITPTKIGQFVTLWKRSAKGPIQPYDVSDAIDFFIISVRNVNYFGQFVFPKSILCEKNIFSTNAKGGKRGIRVYPPWDKTTSKQAKKTQEWQIKYFLEISKDHSIDCARVKLLYSRN